MFYHLVLTFVLKKLHFLNTGIVSSLMIVITYADDGVGMRVLLTLYVFMKSSERSRLYVGMLTIRLGDVFLLDAKKTERKNFQPIVFCSYYSRAVRGNGLDSEPRI